MATLQMIYMKFDETMETFVNHLGLDGKVYHDNLHHLYVKRIAFHFKHRYLTILDNHDYQMDELDPKTIIENSAKHLMEIRNQFNYYFNAIWC